MKIKRISRRRLSAFRREWDRVAPEVVWNPKDYIFGIFDEKWLVGYAYFTINGGVGKLNELLVNESARRKGYGRKTMDYFRRFCIKKGCHKLVLRTSEKHVEAIAFYERYGFKKEAIHRRDKNKLTWYTYSMFLK